MRMQRDVGSISTRRNLPDESVFGGGMSVVRVVYAAIVRTS